ncbi:MAG: DUF1289 domain-containing protein [Pseudomonadales bacterium]
MDKSPQSPCVSICVLNEEDICVGCYRSSDEIIRWSGCTDEQKTEVLSNSQQRRLDDGLFL